MKRASFLFLLSLLPCLAWAGSPFQNFSQITADLNTNHFYSQTPKQQLKIAVFDNGFAGYQAELGKSLPENLSYHPGTVASPAQEEEHGRYMAEILYGVLTNAGASPALAPAELHLYNTYGYTNFSDAIDDAISRHVDLILYSQTWEYGGNNDGAGFINSLVNKATSAGILWINDAGNFGNTTFNSPIKTVADDWVDLGGQNNALEIRCEQNPTNKCLLRLVLSWNDFQNDVNTGTDKDLDFVLTDDMLNVQQGSNLIQSKNPPAGRPGYSLYPREIIEASVAPGLYLVRVKNRSKNFTDSDRLRITASGDFVTMERHDSAENLLNPADNKSVITVGALDSEKSSVSMLLNKPEVLTNSLISLSATENYKGSSNSAAMVAGSLALLKSLDPSLTREQLLSLTTQSRTVATGAGLPLDSLAFFPTDPTGCFQEVSTPKEDLPAFISNILGFGGTLVNTNQGWKVFYDFDPITLLPGIFRRTPNDILVYTTQGPGIYNRVMARSLPNTMIEILQTPMGQTICGTNNANPSIGHLFRLPNSL